MVGMKMFSEISLEPQALFGQRKPEFQNFLKVLRRERPSRYTIFDFFLNDDLEGVIAGWDHEPVDENDKLVRRIEAFTKVGYDCVTIHASNYEFYHGENQHGKASVSVNEGAVVTDRESYEKYPWREPEDYYNGRLEYLAPFLPDGMKFLVYSPGGVLENVMAITGYDNLCYLLADDPELLEDLFHQVGSRLLRYYQQVVGLDCVGALISNDDWGFNTQTMLSGADMRKYVFPWHRKFVELAHSHGKPIFLHSCGQLERVMDDVIDDLNFDGKHSYEDKIFPVEQAYDAWHDRIAIIGGIDMDYVCRKSPEEIYNRCCQILQQTGGVGYALGSGNSVPYYVPYENYRAMVAAALCNEMEV